MNGTADAVWLYADQVKNYQCGEGGVATAHPTAGNCWVTRVTTLSVGPFIGGVAFRASAPRLRDSTAPTAAATEMMELTLPLNPFQAALVWFKNVRNLWSLYAKKGGPGRVQDVFNTKKSNLQVFKTADQMVSWGASAEASQPTGIAICGPALARLSPTSKQAGDGSGMGLYSQSGGEPPRDCNNVSHR